VAVWGGGGGGGGISVLAFADTLVRNPLGMRQYLCNSQMPAFIEFQ
jgi:hypothetical protein